MANEGEAQVQAGGLAVVLSEPARQRLVTIAADVLGRLGTDDVPPTLRPVARFTPAKRARLGATRLAAALDLDDDFRAKVAEIVLDAAGPLAQAVQDGAPGLASDPVDTAVVAYLLRPDGWQQTVADANEQWLAQRRATGSAVAEAELTRLREQVAGLKAELRAESARSRAAAADAVDTRADELVDLRQRLRARGADLREAQLTAQRASAELAEARQRAEAAETARDNEVRRARGRIADLERTLEAARRSARIDRDLDEARLWLLVETLTDAAAGIRRELSLSAPSLRPADAVRSADGAATSRSADDPAALERLLALPNAHLIIDGYNVTKTGYGELPLAQQRARLVGALAALGGRHGGEVTVAFDGGERPPVAPPSPRGVRVLFSAADEIADDLIRGLVAAEPPGRPVIVVSSDRAVQRDIQRAGAWSVPSAVLLARLAQI